ncbi:hypothetical protein NUM3379_19620 [Kineococcus sp. NUM-3379]
MKLTTRAVGAAAGLATAVALAPAATAHAATQAPDLVVTSVAWGPDEPVPGGPVRFSAVIRNTGTSATPSGVVHGVQFKVDGVMTTWSDDHRFSLLPGESVQVFANGGPKATALWRATRGPHTITAEVDDARRIAERDERNNRLDRALTVSPVRGSGSVESTLRVGRAADGSPELVVGHALGAYTRSTYVEAAVTGTLYGACYRTADRTPVSGTEKVLAPSVGVGTTNPYAGGPSGYAIETQVASSTRASRASAPVSLIPIHRGYYHLPAEMVCPAGSEGAFSRWHVTQVASARYLQGSWSLDESAAVDTDRERVSVNYSLHS